jgi:hypothetical protein
MKIRNKLFIIGVILIIIPIIGIIISKTSVSSEVWQGAPTGQDYINWMLGLSSGFIGSILLIISFIMTIINWISKKE